MTALYDNLALARQLETETRHSSHRFGPTLVRRQLSCDENVSSRNLIPLLSRLGGGSSLKSFGVRSSFLEDVRRTNETAFAAGVRAAWRSRAWRASGTTAFAQGGGATSSLSGIVADPSGGIIPGASVTVKNTATADGIHRRHQRQRRASRSPRLTPAPTRSPSPWSGSRRPCSTMCASTPAVPATVRVTLELGGVEETVLVSAGSRNHPDPVGGGVRDHRHQRDSQAAHRQPQRPRLHHVAARASTHQRATATPPSTACRRAPSTSPSTASARRTTG